MAERQLALPPSTWQDGVDIFTSNMDMLTTTQFPEVEEDLQGRLVNRQQRRAPVPREGVLLEAGTSTRDYSNALKRHGFPEESVKGLVFPRMIEEVGRSGLDLLRIVHIMKTPADGQLNAIIRTSHPRSSRRGH